MSELIYNKETVDNYKTNFTTEKDDFSNNSFSTFKNSYLNTSGEELVNKMASSLNENYTKIENGYTNINDYWDKYNEANTSLESSISSFTASCSNETVNGYLSSFIGEITNYSDNNHLDNIDKLTAYSDQINALILENSKKYNIDVETLSVYVILNASSINTESDINRVIDTGTGEISKYTDSLKQKGFPDDYASKLTTLHLMHPDWEFEPTKVGITLDEAVKEETSDYERNTTQKADEKDGSGHQPEKKWYTASNEAVKNSMDPRNYMNEKNIFMFEKITYNADISKSDVSKSIENTYFSNKTYQYNGKTYTFEETFDEVGKNNDVNSVYLTSRALQEQGASGSATAEMVGDDGETYYNYYNFNAYGSTTDEVVKNGLSYAKEQGWNNPYKAIDGAASKIATEYINNNQDTVYYQKYNVKSENKYEHQYMANIHAPADESEKTYEVYKNCEMLDNKHYFDIPVYDE